MIEAYLKIFIDEEYPSFLSKYLETDTMRRLFDVSQFCGCDYTNLYQPLFYYSRFYHSLVVAHMTWHFTHNKKETIAALLHDVGTPCFAHCIDYVFGDYEKQESSERMITDMILFDSKLLQYLKDDGLSLKDLSDFSSYPILENKSPMLCTDRLDGVFHTCYIWLHTHFLEQISLVYHNLVVLENEYGCPEIGFQSKNVALDFVSMVEVYAKELQGNRDKYVMKYISDMVQSLHQKGLLSLEDLYSLKESDICTLFSQYPSWAQFQNARDIISTDRRPVDHYCISFDTKRRNTIPLIMTEDGAKRITDESDYARHVYEELEHYHDCKYAYVKSLKKIM